MQVPIDPLSVIVVPLVPLLLQTPVALKVTGRPEPPPVADTVNGGSLVNFGGSVLKVIVWLACVMDMETASERLLVVESAALVAVTVQVPTAIGVIVEPDTEQVEAVFDA